MNDKIFFDTNIILYSYSDKSEPKKNIARKCILDSEGIISTQVMQEICNILIKKLKHGKSSVSKTLVELSNNFFVFINDIQTVSKALDIHFMYHFSYYDSLIIASALQNKCSILYSEDLHHSQKIEDSLTIINPFI
jgi:predicted nucleic acid-binding protein